MESAVIIWPEYKLLHLINRCFAWRAVNRYYKVDWRSI